MNLFLIPPAIVILLSLPLSAQTCSGNLGENIFTAGDFGGGVANILTPDPGIAPGFQYQPNPPPNDGFYTITNNTGRWGNNFGSWQSFPDNSDDPNGYMMIVNAAFTPSLFYEQEVEGLCENTLYVFSADVRNVIAPNTGQLLPNVSFLLDGVDQFETGPIAETGEWNTYGFTFTTGPAQTSLILALRNNAPGGFGNDLALDNIEFRACGPEARIAGPETVRLCEDGGPARLTAVITGDQYDEPALQWQQSFDGGVSWVDLTGETDLIFLHAERPSGRYRYRYRLANGVVNLANGKCRVVSNVKEIFVVPKRYEIVDTICAGRIFVVGASTYNQAGTSVDTLLSSLGCDSIVTLRLAVVDDPGIEPEFAVTDPSCDYLTDGGIDLVSLTNGAGPYEYVLDSAVRSETFVYTGLGEGDYAYRLTDRFGCATEGTLTLTSPNPFAFDLGEDRAFILGEGFRLTTGAGGDIANYVFTPAGVVDCTTGCEGETITPTESVTLFLDATSDRGCAFRDSVRLAVVKQRLVYPPTAFSPNGDGINDRFALFGAMPNVTRIIRLEVYDRWGGLAFAVDDLDPNGISQGWDGRIDGTPAPGGTYYYVAEVLFLDGVVLKYGGDFVLIR